MVAYKQVDYGMDTVMETMDSGWRELVTNYWVKKTEIRVKPRD